MNMKYINENGLIDIGEGGEKIIMNRDTGRVS